MILLDVNVLLAAYSEDHPFFGRARELLHALLNGDTTFGVPEIVLQSFVRVVTQPAYPMPVTAQDAFAFCQVLRDSDTCHVVQPQASHWTTFARLCLASNARGNLVADAYLAAFAVDRDDEWFTLDRDFAKFPGLRWRMLGESTPRTNPA